MLPPLDLKGLAGLDQLTEDEKTFCSTIRMTPTDYLENRVILHEESSRSDGIRLQIARGLLKIDVNRTKKLFDFLIAAGTLKALPRKRNKTGSHHLQLAWTNVDRGSINKCEYFFGCL